MRIALETWGRDFEQLRLTGRRAEELGYDAVYYGESPSGLHLECWTALAALAAVTERIRLGPVITNVLPTYRSLALHARQIATVAIASGGRLDLRTGVGASIRHGRAWWSAHGVAYGSYDERLAELRRAVPDLCRLLAGDAVDLGAGRPVELGLDLPAIPVTIAATGRRAMLLAAEHADQWETSFCTPDEVRDRIARFASLCPDRVVPCSLEIDAFVATDRSRADAIEAAVATRRAAAGARVDAIMARALRGTPADIAVHMRALAAAGVEQLVVVPDDPHDPDALEAIATARAMSTA